MSEWNMDDEGACEALFNDNHLEYTVSEHAEQSISDIKEELSTLQCLIAEQSIKEFADVCLEEHYAQRYSSSYTYL